MSPDAEGRFRGITVTHVPWLVDCDECGGSGLVPYDIRPGQSVHCPECKGRGMVPRTQQPSGD